MWKNLIIIIKIKFYIRENIFKEIIILLENYAIINNLDLILDTTSYLIASNSIDITEFIKDELNNIKLKLEYTNFEKIKYIDIKFIRKNSLEIKSKISNENYF